MLPEFSHFRALFKSIFVAILTCSVAYLWLVVAVILNFSGNAQLPAECALVFGAAVRGEGSAGPGIERRTQTAVRLYHEEKVDRLILSGGKGSAHQESEAAVMRKVAMRDGVDPDDILLEENATSTWENIEMSRKLTSHCASVVGVSDRYHLARIRFTAWMQTFDNFTVHPADRYSQFVFEVRSVLREAAGIVYYAVR